MISIKDTVGAIWLPCPKCKSYVQVERWGEQTCLYEKCDGHKFTVNFSFDMAQFILKQMENDTARAISFPKHPIKRPSKPKLQKYSDGWLSVAQPESENPDDWCFNDPFKK